MHFCTACAASPLTLTHTHITTWCHQVYSHRDPARRDQDGVSSAQYGKSSAQHRMAFLPSITEWLSFVIIPRKKGYCVPRLAVVAMQVRVSTNRKTGCAVSIAKYSSTGMGRRLELKVNTSAKIRHTRTDRWISCGRSNPNDCYMQTCSPQPFALAGGQQDRAAQSATTMATRLGVTRHETFGQDMESVMGHPLANAQLRLTNLAIDRP